MIKKERNHAYVCYAVISFKRRHVGRRDNDLLKKIAALPERKRFLISLNLVGERIGRLNVYLVETCVDDEVNLKLFPRRFSILLDIDFNNSDVNSIPAGHKLVVYDVLHQVSILKLAKIQPDVSQPDIFAVKLRRIVQISLPLNVVPVNLREQVGVAKIADLTGNGRAVRLQPLLRIKLLRQLVGICQRSDRRRQYINVATLKLVRNLTYFNPCNI